VTTKDVLKLEDTGFSQSLTTEKGFRLEKTGLKNIVTLRPFCTFREIDQPERMFLVRMKKGKSENELPTVALFRADGDIWKLDAVQAIKRWIEVALAKKNLQVTVIA
jgi:hypothetical protein